MSLRAFHLLFIALSIALSGVFAAWAVEEYRAGGAPGYAVAAGVALAGAAVLTGYAARFWRQTRDGSHASGI